MPQSKKEQKTPGKVKKDSTRPRNESVPSQGSVGTSNPKEINAENSPEVRDALNETQV